MDRPNKGGCTSFRPLALSVLSFETEGHRVLMEPKICMASVYKHEQLNPQIPEVNLVAIFHFRHM